MLDEEEYAIVSKLYAAAFDRRNFPPNQRLTIDERFKPVRDAYERLTGLSNPMCKYYGQVTRPARWSGGWS